METADMTTELEMKLQEILKFELIYLDELEVMVQVLVEESKTDPDLLKSLDNIYWLHKNIITTGVKKHLKDPHLLKKIFSQHEDKMKRWYGNAHKGIKLVERNNMGFINRHISRYFLFFRELQKFASKNGNFLDAGLYKDISDVAKGIIVTINQNLTYENEGWTMVQVRRRVMMSSITGYDFGHSHTCPTWRQVWQCYYKKHLKNRKTLPFEHLIGFQCVKLIFLKYVAITTVTIITVNIITVTIITVTITTVTITTVTITTVNITTVTITTVTITTVTITSVAITTVTITTVTITSITITQSQ